MNQSKISIIIPVYKNYEMFYKYLKINSKYFDNCEVIIMNDYPQENITNKVRNIYPSATVINNNHNLGFAGNVNKGVKLAKYNYVFLMNSDVILQDNTFQKSINHFEKNNNLFAIGFAQKEKSGKIVGGNYGYFKDGLINHGHKPITNNNKLINNFWAEGGSSIFDKKKFVMLGMFDELFNPFYWEDVDLSYRAMKVGFEILFDPSVIVRHEHESTIGKYFDQLKILKTAYRNQLIFQWKNITDSDLLFKHLINVPRFILKPGFFDALSKLPQILKLRKKTVKLFIRSDKEILNQYA